METLPKLTSVDLEDLPEDGKLYELIEGELYVSRQPSWDHQYTCVRLSRFLDEWNEQTGLGVVNAAPGLIFAEDDDVAPDLVWISQSTLSTALGEDRKLHSRLNWLLRFYRQAFPTSNVIVKRNLSSTAGAECGNTGSLTGKNMKWRFIATMERA